MIEKIISDGQTGAGRAALDVAIKFNIHHGGWIPRGCKVEDGRHPDRYDLKELTTSSYPACIEWNIIESDGTLILSHGPVTGESKLTQQLAKKNKAACLQIDLKEAPDYNAAYFVCKWAHENRIQILNVTGSKTSKNPLIYDVVYRVLKGVYWTDRIAGYANFPEGLRNVKKVNDAVDQLFAELSPLKHFIAANMTEEDLSILQSVLEKYIDDALNEGSVCEELYTDCLQKADGEQLDDAVASAVILRELFDRLR